MADERIEEIKQRLATATKGEWVARDQSTPRVTMLLVHAGHVAIASLTAHPDVGDKTPEEARANAHLIAHAPADLFYLLSEVERLSAPGYKDTRDPTTCPRCRHPRHGGECAKVISRDVNWACRCSYVNGSAPSGETGEGPTG